jgi:3-dehydroquinate synthetase
MRRDKKSALQAIRLVLLRGIGAAELTADYPHAAMVLSLRAFTKAR